MLWIPTQLRDRLTVFRRKLFVQAIGDEVLLRQQAKLLLADRKTPLDCFDLEKISKEHGVDMAACCYYESLLSSEHGHFKNKIDHILSSNRVINTQTLNKIKILLVPGMFYNEHPEVGADGALVLSIARHCGFDAQIIPVLSKGRMAENVKIINKWMEQEAATIIWFVSLSKGSGELRHYIQSYDVPTSVKGWINIAGILQGTAHAKRKRSTKLRRLVYRVLCKLFRVDYQVLAELDPDSDSWKNNHWKQSLEYIHLVPIPLRSHLQAVVSKRYEKLLSYRYEPNDGIVPVADVNSLPGKIYPLWGVDHFVRTPLIAELLYKFFTYIAQTENKQE